MPNDVGVLYRSDLPTFLDLFDRHLGHNLRPRRCPREPVQPEAQRLLLWDLGIDAVHLEWVEPIDADRRSINTRLNGANPADQSRRLLLAST